MRYNWQELEKEYILGDYKTITDFLKAKNITSNGTNRKHTSGWNDKKRQANELKKTKTIEKVIERQAEQEAIENIQVNDVAIECLKKARELLKKVFDARDLKSLTSALNDINTIMNKDNEKEDKIDKYLTQIERAFKDVE